MAWRHGTKSTMRVEEEEEERLKSDWEEEEEEEEGWECERTAERAWCVSERASDLQRARVGSDYTK